jgi:hypothetical protein
MRIRKAQPPIAAGAVLLLSRAVHAFREILLDTLTGSVVTLPPATGSGDEYYVYEKVAATSNSHIVKVNNSVDVMAGSIGITSAGTPGTFPTVAASDTVTLNRTTTGGATNGGWLAFTDIAAGIWQVRGFVNGSGVAATPFSATV